MTTTAPLPSGAAIPLLGFGTWQLKGQQATEATTAALDAGYAHLDTATMYGNEAEIGAALDGRQAFVTTKLPPDHADRAQATLEESLSKLRLERVDLWLVHWPPRDSVALWKQFVQAQRDGLVTDIGVSNYDLDGLDELERATGVAPAVNQVPWSPLSYDQATVDGHRERGVVLEGYSTLKGGTLTHPTVTEIADRTGRTPAQVLIRWHLEHGIVVIPKSATPERITSNAQVEDWTLDESDVTALDALGR